MKDWFFNDPRLFSYVFGVWWILSGAILMFWLIFRGHTRLRLDVRKIDEFIGR